MARIKQDTIQEFREKLLAWYDREHRKLPWRLEPGLYPTVVSEFMLQQTQVETVLPYYQRWMERFPDFGTLASAEIEEVIKYWEGLGYYRRARNLHQLAKELTEAGEFPESARDWQKLTGIGPYTAAAIASICQNEVVPVIDGNVIRVLARWLADDVEVSSSSQAQKHFQIPAESLLDPDRPGDFNQAMMELGARICRKQKPACLLCPVSGSCAGRKNGRTEELPLVRKKKRKRASLYRLVALRREALFLVKRPSGGRMAGLYEFPQVQDLQPDCFPVLFSGRRAIGNTDYEETFVKVPASDSVIGKIEGEWIPLDFVDRISLSGPHRRWLPEILSLYKTEQPK